MSKAKELVKLIRELSDEPAVRAALEKARSRDDKYQDMGRSARNYEWVARVASRTIGRHFTKGVRLEAGRILAEQEFSSRSE